MQTEHGTDVVRFAGFVLDTRSGELWKDGRRIALHDQPFQILRLLTERPGEVVTREEICGRLWPDDTVVEFDNAVNAAIKKLRIALADSAEEPRYVETLRRRGYRLIVPVDSAEGVGNWGAAATSPEVAARAADVDTPATFASRTGAGHVGGFRRWQVIAAAAGVPLAIVCLAYGISRRTAHATAKITDRNKIVLADFANKTGDPIFSDTLRQGLAVQLEQSPFLSLVGEERVRQVLDLMGQPASAALTPAIAREVCQRAGGAAVVEGSIVRLGSQYVLWLRTRDCQSGAVMDEEQLQAARKEDVLGTLSQMSSNFRSRVGEGLGTVRTLDTPLAEATTPSLDALKAYSMGLKLLYTSGGAAAIPLLERAVEIDPSFAIAHAMLGRLYGDVAESERSAESTTKAWQLRRHANDRERFFIDASYQIQVIGDMERARRTCEAWAHTYPRDPQVRGFLSGAVYPMLGEYRKALEEAHKMLELDPDFPVSYNLVALAYLPLGQVEEARRILDLASERKMQMPDLLVDRFQVAFLQSDPSGMEKAVALAVKMPGAEDLVANQEAFGSAYVGHLQQAQRRSSFAVQLAERAGQRERAALFQSGEAVREAFFGNAAAARQSARTALALSNGKEVEYGAAFAQALAGNAAVAQTVAQDLQTRFPEDTSVAFWYAPTLRALEALARHQPSKALGWLQVSSAYETGEPESCFYGYFGVLYPAYVRGEAYLALHQGALAAAEFQRIVDHRGIVITDPVGAMAQLQLGRARRMTGERAQARSAYNDFLRLWKDADSDIPVLRQAKAEYAELN